MVYRYFAGKPARARSCSGRHPRAQPARVPAQGRQRLQSAPARLQLQEERLHEELLRVPPGRRALHLALRVPCTYQFDTVCVCVIMCYVRHIADLLCDYASTAMPQHGDVRVSEEDARVQDPRGRQSQHQKEQSRPHAAAGEEQQRCRLEARVPQGVLRLATPATATSPALTTPGVHAHALHEPFGSAGALVAKCAACAAHQHVPAPSRYHH